MEKYVSLERSFIRRHYFPTLLLTLLLCALSGGIMSFRNLSQNQAAMVMEMYVAFLGILLLTPLFVPEQDREIWMLEQSKAFSLWKLYLLRTVTAIVILVLVISGFLGVLAVQSKGLDLGRLWWGSICEILFLGSLGYFVGAVTNQVILGYMVSVLYYIVNVGGSKRLGVFALFRMMKEEYGFWPYMLAAALLLIAAGVFLREFRSRRRN